MMNPETNRFEEVFAKGKDSLKEAFSDNADEAQRSLDKLRAKFVRQDGSPVPKEYPVFKIGEEHRINGYRFKVKAIRPDELVFEPVGPMPKTKTKWWTKKRGGKAQQKNRKGKRR